MARTTRQNRTTPKSPLNDYPREDLKTFKNPVASAREMDDPAQSQKEQIEDDKTVTKKRRRADNNAQAVAGKKRRTDHNEQQQHDMKRGTNGNIKPTTDKKRQTLQPSAPVKQRSRVAALEDPDAHKQPKMSNKARTPARQVTREAPSGAREQPIIPEDRELVVENLARDDPILRPEVAADILQVRRYTFSITGSSVELTGLPNTKAAEQAAPKQAKAKRARDLPRATQVVAQEQPAQQEPVVPQTSEAPQPYHTSYGGNSDRERDQRIISWMNNTRQAENEAKKAAEPRKKPLPLEGANKVDDEHDAAAPKAKPKKIPTLGRRNQVIVASRKKDTDELIEGEDYVVSPGGTTYYFDLDHFADEETSRSDDTSSIEPTEDYHYIWVWRWGERKRKRVPNKRPGEVGAFTVAPVGSGAAAPKKSGPRVDAAIRAVKDSKDSKPAKHAEEISGGPDGVYGGATGPGVMRSYGENKRRLEHARIGDGNNQDADVDMQDDEEDENNAVPPPRKRKNNSISQLTPVEEPASDQNNKKRGKQARASRGKKLHEDVEEEQDVEDEGNTTAPRKKRKDNSDARPGPGGGSSHAQQKVHQTRQKVRKDKPEE